MISLAFFLLLLTKCRAGVANTPELRRLSESTIYEHIGLRLEGK